MLRTATIAAALPSVAIAVIGTLLFSATIIGLRRQQVGADRLLNHTVEVIATVQKVEFALLTAMGEGRAFIIGQPNSVDQDFETAAHDVVRQLDALEQVVGAEPDQKATLDAIRPLAIDRLRAFRSVIALARDGSLQQAVQTLRQAHGRLVVAGIQRRLEAIRDQEQRQLAMRLKAANQKSQRLLAVLLFFGLLIAASSWISANQVLTTRRERRDKIRLQTANMDLERTVQARTADLVEKQAALRESEAGFRMLAENATDVIARVAADGRHLYISPAAAGVFGTDPAALVEHGILGHLHPGDRAAIGDAQANLLAGETASATITARVLHPERGVVWAEIAARTIVDPATNRPDGYVSLIRDVTERHRIEQALRINSQQYRLLAECTTDAITCLDMDLRRTYASPSVLAIFGYTPTEMLGATPADHLLHPGDSGRVMAALRALLDGTSDLSELTFRARHKHGHFIWAEMRIGVQHGRDGRPASLVLSARDITDRRRQAEQLQEANIELERLAGHLAQERDRAEHASAAKTRFLAAVSHELRTPLNGILGYAQLLQIEGSLTPRQTKRVDGMLQAGQHLLSLIGRVLDISQIERNPKQFNSGTTLLRETATWCIGLIGPAAQAKGLQLALDQDPSLPPSILTDTTALRQILLNLLGNAVKFTTNGSVVLQVGRTGTDRVRFAVIDTGPGIPRHQRHRLCSEFDRLGEQDSEGAGLGLALSARLVTTAGGTLAYDDNPGGGSVFSFDLPLGTGAALPARNPDEHQAAPAQAAPLRLLVVDDVDINRDVAQALLHADGHKVTCARDGLAAVEAAAANDFDVILMDVRMPGIDGLAATRMIRGLPGARALVPIIALTADAFTDQIEQCRAAGMSAHVAKPFSPETLREALAGAVRDPPARAGRKPGPGTPHSRTDPADPAGALFDTALFQDMQALVMTETASSMLDTVRTRAEALLAEVQPDRANQATVAALAASAHALAGSAGIAGFTRLATAAQRFERAAGTGGAGIEAATRALAETLEATLERYPTAGSTGRS